LTRILPQTKVPCKTTEASKGTILKMSVPANSAPKKVKKMASGIEDDSKPKAKKVAKPSLTKSLVLTSNNQVPHSAVEDAKPKASKSAGKPCISTSKTASVSSGIFRPILATSHGFKGEKPK